MKKYCLLKVFAVISLLIIATGIICSAYPVNPFIDVSEGQYYYEPIIWAVDNGITTGMSPNTFEPERKCTRAQIVTFLYRAAGSPSITVERDMFSDVRPTDYFYKAVNWAVKRNITTGISATKFAPEEICSRAQAVTFFYRALKSPQAQAAVNPYKDIKEKDYFYLPVLWAYEKGITNGIDDTHFSPNGDCTRGQIVTFLYRLLKEKPYMLDDNYMEADRTMLEENMKDMLNGSTMLNETVMFIDEGDEKELMFDIDEIISVTNYDGSIVYKENIDYSVEKGKIKALSGTSMPIITGEKYYNYPGSALITEHGGKSCPTWWGEEKSMTQYQINVSYTHKDTWDGFVPECQSEYFKNLIEKFEKGEDITIVFYGDSITYGACASFISNYSPYQYSYPLMLTKSLAQIYGYKITYVPVGKVNTSKVPRTESFGNRGRLRYINAAVGGWTSGNGVDNFEDYVTPFVDRYGCDLFVLAFGMNDGGSNPTTYTYANQKKIIDRLLKLESDSAILMVSTMVPNPNATNGWYGKQDQQESVLVNGAEEYRRRGIECGVAKMTSVSKSILEHKEFCDYSGNNINHPNDFFTRVYAQTLFRTIIGY